MGNELDKYNDDELNQLNNVEVVSEHEVVDMVYGANNLDVLNLSDDKEVLKQKLSNFIVKEINTLSTSEDKDAIRVKKSYVDSLIKLIEETKPKSSNDDNNLNGDGANIQDILRSE